MPKRPRNDESTDDVHIPVTDRKRHPTLWFDDGNIVLTTNLSRFRVHRGVLSMNSPVFADMLSMPQPDHIEDSFEGLPVVEISDNDTDFTHLMCFFYDHRYYQGGTETTFEKISGLLRMSTKYQMEDLRNEIISHLALGYPSTLEKYAEAVDTKTQLPLFPSFPGQHFAVVKLARETDASILLPTALWRSMCMISQHILHGAVDLKGRRYLLSLADVQLCILTKSQVLRRLVRMENMFTSLLKSPGCARRNQNGSQDGFPCAEIAMSKINAHFSSHAEEIRDDHDMFTQMAAFEVWRPLVCDHCGKEADSTLSDARASWWSYFPTLFGLPK